MKKIMLIVCLLISFSTYAQVKTYNPIVILEMGGGFNMGTIIDGEWEITKPFKTLTYDFIMGNINNNGFVYGLGFMTNLNSFHYYNHYLGRVMEVNDYSEDILGTYVPNVNLWNITIGGTIKNKKHLIMGGIEFGSSTIEQERFYKVQGHYTCTVPGSLKKIIGLHAKYRYEGSKGLSVGVNVGTSSIVSFSLGYNFGKLLQLESK